MKAERGMGCDHVGFSVHTWTLVCAQHLKSSWIVWIWFKPGFCLIIKKFDLIKMISNHQSKIGSLINNTPNIRRVPSKIGGYFFFNRARILRFAVRLRIPKTSSRLLTGVVGLLMGQDLHHVLLFKVLRQEGGLWGGH